MVEKDFERGVRSVRCEARRGKPRSISPVVRSPTIASGGPCALVRSRSSARYESPTSPATIGDLVMEDALDLDGVPTCLSDERLDVVCAAQEAQRRASVLDDGSAREEEAGF
jgi:hypothetical protein